MVARLALEAGAEIVNDVSGFTWDPDMASTIAAHPCGAILMHVRGLPHQWRTLPAAPDIVSLVRDELRALATRALDAGIARDRLVLDPGFGFGKIFDENYPLLAHFGDFHALGFPLLAAASRKTFLGHTVSVRLAELTGAPHLPSSADVGSARASVGPHPRDAATLAASVAAALAGAHIVRVHAVRPAVEALAIADAILRSEESHEDQEKHEGAPS
jgi:dihydropteroate synthase